MINEDESIRAFFTRVSLLHSESDRIVQRDFLLQKRINDAITDATQHVTHYGEMGQGYGMAVNWWQGRRQAMRDVLAWMNEQP